MIIPGLFGANLVEGDAAVGVFVGLVILAGSGWRICASAPSFINCFSLGTLFVAATQFVPVLQFMAGLVGIALVGAFSPTLEINPDDPNGFMLFAFQDGLAVTLIAGGLLALVAIGIGLFMRFVWPGYARRETKPRILTQGVPVHSPFDGSTRSKENEGPWPF